MIRTLLIATIALSADAAAPTAELFSFDHGLTVDLTGLEEIEHSDGNGEQLAARWEARFGEHQLELMLFVLDRSRFGLDEPEDVADLIEENRDGMRFEHSQLVESEFYGWTPYAALARGPLKDGTKVTGTYFCLGGLGEEIAYSLEVECSPAPAGKDLEALETLIAESLAIEVESTREWEWTEEEVEARWERDVPEDLYGEMKKIVRTDHYIILTNSSSGPKFGKKMEECYDTVKELFPFQEVEQRKLMPVFLFRTRDQYAEFFVKVAGTTKAEALRSAGHAWKDYYATTYEAPGDPTHLHEAVHQIFGNRLRLGGGGSWFQEGVAEYTETKPKERKNWAGKAAKKGTFMPFKEFFEVQSMLYSGGAKKTGGSSSTDNYTQAASIIEFARDGKFQPEKFQEFIHAVGRTKRRDLQQIEAALLSVYGVDIEEFEAEWVDYWKRK